MKTKRVNILAGIERMTGKRSLMASLAVLLLLPFIAACTSNADLPFIPLTAPLPEVRIGLSLPNDSESQYLSIKNGVESLILRRGGRLISSSAENDASRQESEIQALLGNNIHVLLIVPIDSERIASSVHAANRADIPVITLDQSASGGRVLAHIGSDNTAAGRMAAHYMVEKLYGQGLIVEIQGSPSAPATRARAEGFSQVMRANPRMQVIAREQANFSREQARQAFAQILEQHPRIDAVFAHNDEMLIGAQAAAQEAGRAAEIIFIGFDGLPAVIAGIESGQYTATIAQQSEEIGRMGAELALKYVLGESVPAAWVVELALLSR